MTRFTDSHRDDVSEDDAFITRLNEAPRPEFAAALYLRLAAGASVAATGRDSGSATTPAADAAPTLPPPGRGRSGRGMWAARSGAYFSAALALLVIVASLILLRDHFAPNEGQRAAASVAPVADLLYPRTLDGRRGIAIVPADGGPARFLVEGNYYGVLASPDGRQFLAYGQTNDALPTALVERYDRSGQLLQRYDLGYSVPLTAYWSPDSRHLALFAREYDRFQTWLLADDGASELRFGAQNYLGTPSGTGAWSAQGRLFVSSVADDSNGDGRIDGSDKATLWSVDASGGDRRRLFEGNAMKLGWSGTGEEIYLLDAGRLLAIDATNGQQRVVATAEEVGRQVTPAAPADAASLPRSSFDDGRAWALVVGPDGDRIALWLTPAAPVGTAARPVSYLVVIDQRGRVVAQDRAVPGRGPLFTTWAPDASHLAYAFHYGDNASGGIRAVGIASDSATSADFAGGVGIDAWMTSPRWSPDGRHLAYLLNGRMVVVDVARGGTETLPGTSHGWPSWLGGVK